MSQTEGTLNEKGMELPPQPSPLAEYVPTVRTGNLVFVAGHGTNQGGELIYRGKVGHDLDVETAYQAAQLVCLNMLASLKAEIGDLDRVKRIVKLLGMV